MHRNTKTPLCLHLSVDKWFWRPGPFFQVQMMYQGLQNPLACSRARPKHPRLQKTFLKFLCLWVSFCVLFPTKHFGDEHRSEDQVEWICIDWMSLSLHRGSIKQNPLCPRPADFKHPPLHLLMSLLAMLQHWQRSHGTWPTFRSHAEAFHWLANIYKTALWPGTA